MFVSKLEFAQHKRQVIRIIEMQRLIQRKRSNCFSITKAINTIYSPVTS